MPPLVAKMEAQTTEKPEEEEEEENPHPNTSSIYLEVSLRVAKIYILGVSFYK